MCPTFPVVSSDCLFQLPFVEVGYAFAYRYHELFIVDSAAMSVFAFPGLFRSVPSDEERHFTADHFKVAIQAITAGDEPFRDDQKTDEFIEIEAGSEDILAQLENVMGKTPELRDTNRQ